MKKRFRTRLLNLALALYTFSERFVPKDRKGPIEWRDHVRWWIEGIGDRIFCFAYEGSAEEIRDALDWGLDTNLEYLTKNQREIRARLCEFVDMEEAQ